ncbi:MAG: hypothetical protein ACRDYU_09905, partial [Actinomycetes bacterium]
AAPAAAWETPDDRGPAWQPVSIPPPTYVTKPAAPSPARTIDLSRPGFWAEGWREANDPGAVADDGHPVAEETSPAEAGSEHELQQQRRAANE